ncbi:MAG TPA: glutathione peroxidase [Pyrinomonadaceae bacterium]|nr:glutathione peroxidase [Pyrinomonadaceae bacterium]
MHKVIALLIVAIVAFAGSLLCPQEPVAAAGPTIFDFKAKDIDGAEVKLKKFKGNVLLVVNTASKCGYTPQYESLEATYNKYKDKRFAVLGFPANNFGNQEPGTEAEIKEFCTSKYRVTFPMFAKISVKGEDIDPLYAYFTDMKLNPVYGGPITWNFNKFLIDRKGNIVARFSSKQAPDNPDVIAAIEAALND